MSETWLEVTPLIRIALAEMACSYVRSSGPGGQNVNKVSSKCVLRWDLLHSPTLPLAVRARFMGQFGSRLTTEGELVLMSDRFRDQRRNYEDCLDKLRELLLSVANPPKIRGKTKPSYGSKKRLRAGKDAHSEKKTQRRKSWDS